MLSINLGTVSCNNIQPVFAYGVLRSTSLPVDALCLAVQGIVLGILFGNPISGAVIGIIASFLDRIFAPIINRCLPGRNHTIMGFPSGIKNTTLMSASIFTSYKLLRVAAPILF